MSSNTADRTLKVQQLVHDPDALADQNLFAQKVLDDINVDHVTNSTTRLDNNIETPKMPPSKVPGPSLSEEGAYTVLQNPPVVYNKPAQYVREEWESHKKIIRELYLNQNRSLKDVMSTLSNKHGLEASVRQWKMKMNEWNFRKHKKRRTSSNIKSFALNDKQRVETVSLFENGYNSSSLPKMNSDEFIELSNHWLSREFPDQPKMNFDLFHDLNSQWSPREYPETLEEDKIIDIDDNGDEDRVLKPLTSRSGQVPMNTDNPSNLGDHQQVDQSLSECEVPFTDSGYRSTLDIDHLPNLWSISVNSSEVANAESSIAEGPGSCSDEDANTVYSIDSTNDRRYSQIYIIELCDNIYNKLCQSIGIINWTTIATIVPGLMKAFANRLCHDSPPQDRKITLEMFFFIQMKHRDIVAQLETLFNHDAQGDPVRDRSHPADISVLGKMNMWNHKVDKDSPIVPTTELFKGAQDKDEIYVDQSMLSTYHNTVFDSTAIDWLIQSITTESQIKLEASEPRFRQLILSKLPPETISKYMTSDYEVVFDLEWYDIMETSLRYETTRDFKHAIRPFQSSIITTGSGTQTQRLTVEQYLTQTWPLTGLRLLSALEEAVKTPSKQHYTTLSGNTQLEVRILTRQLMVTITGPAYSAADCGEQLAWIGSALRSTTQSVNGYYSPVIKNFRIDPPSFVPGLLKYKGYCSFSFECIPLEESDNALHTFSQNFHCAHTIILGFPTLRRPEGFPGLEIPFDTLLSYLQASESEIIDFKLFIKGPESVLSLIKHVDNVFLWRTCHSLPGCSSCCPETNSSLAAAEGFTYLDSHAFKASRHVISKCADNPAAVEDLYRCSNVIFDRPPETSQLVGQPSPADDRTFSPRDQYFAQEFNSGKDISHSRIIGSVRSVPDSLPLSYNDESPENPKVPSHNLPVFLERSPFSSGILSGEDSLDSDMFSISDSSEDMELPVNNDNRCSVTINLANKLVAGFQMATAYQSSPGTEVLNSYTVTNTIDSAHTGTSRTNLKRYLPQDQEEESRSDDESRRKRSKNMKPSRENVPDKSFACPFLKWNSTTYRGCCVKKLSSISYVKQHLHRKHTPERYCQACHSTNFNNDDELQSHVATGKCVCRVRTMTDGISYQQRFKLSRKSKSKSSKESQWFAIWDILFPRHDRPNSVYLDAGLTLEMCQFRDYCQRYGPSLIREQIELEAVSLSLGVSIEQDHVLDRIITQGLTTLFENWSSRTSPPPTSSSRQSNSNSEQSRDETPANSLVDSGIATGSHSSFTDARLEGQGVPPLSVIPAGGYTAPPLLVETGVQASSVLQDTFVMPDPATTQRFPSTSLGHTAGNQSWESEYQNNDFEKEPHDEYDEDFDFSAFS